MIGKEALFAILGLKRFKDDDERLRKFVRSHVRRLLKMDLVTVLGELERQEEVDLALKVTFFFSPPSEVAFVLNVFFFIIPIV